MSRVRAGVIGVRALKEECAGVARSVLNRGLASENEVKSLKPGGEKNPDTSVWGWLHFYVCLHRLMERENIAAGRSVRPDQKKQPNASTASQLGQEEEVLKMLGGIGERVDLNTPLGEVTFLVVEPKGMLALEEIDAVDHDARWIAARLVVLMELRDEGLAKAEDLQTLQLAAQRILELQARLVWIITSAGPQCPYDPVREATPAVPEYLLNLDPLDLTRLLMAHRRVNGTRLSALEPFVPTGKPSMASPSWSVFIAATARELRTDPELLMRHWALQKIVANAAAAAKARLDAEEAAKKEAAAARQSA